MSNLPPWSGDNDWMERWVNEQLSEREAAMERWVNEKNEQLAEQNGSMAMERWLSEQSWGERETWMGRWVNELLGERETWMERAWQGKDGPELYAADHGDLEPLKKKYPHLRPYLRLPKQRRGRRFSSLPKPSVLGAVADVRRIRALWRAVYGKQNRRQHEGEISAEDIAARRWGIEVEDVYKSLKAEPGWRKSITKGFLEYADFVFRLK